ncbi:cyd operon YbgE family protein [Lysobacter sp. ESA13C]|uniref:cyd operon YbgE family protein n=1 Tax=unclassified Lysobacter TaxID=2635362 RepID=UPI001CC02244|nr:cyd operon YbgE family protein [Lysobacter sp. ESA13C]
MARAVSLLLASALSLGLLFLPAMRGGEMTTAAHGWLSPLMLSICAGFVHGVGYRPVRPWARALLHPLLLWPAMAGLAVMWARSF